MQMENGGRGMIWVVSSCMIVIEGRIKGRVREGLKKECVELRRKVFWKDFERVVKVEGVWKVWVGGDCLGFGEIEREGRWVGFVEERLKVWNPKREVFVEGFAGVGPGEEVGEEVGEDSGKLGGSVVTSTSSISGVSRGVEGDVDSDFGGKVVEVEEVVSSSDGLKVGESDFDAGEAVAEEGERDVVVDVDDDDMVWKTKDDPVDRAAGKEYSERKERARIVLDASVKRVFNRFFVADVTDYHKENGHSRIKVCDWARGADGYMSRAVCFVKQLGYRLGPKETRVQETHRYSFKSNGGVLVEIEGNSLDVPFSSYFTVESYFEIEPIPGKNDKCELVSSVSCRFEKKGWLCSKIESGCLEQTKVSFTKMNVKIQRILEEEKKEAKAAHAKAISGKKPPVPKRRTHYHTATLQKDKNTAEKESVVTPRVSEVSAEENNEAPRECSPVSTVPRTSIPQVPRAPESPIAVPHMSAGRTSAVEEKVSPVTILQRGSVVAVVLLALLLLYSTVLLFISQRQISSLQRLLQDRQ